MNREQIRDDINRRPLTDFIALERSPKAGANMYACPVCGSGTGRNKTGALHIYPDTKRVICYSGKLCFTDRGEDTLGALRTIWKCGEAEAMVKAGYTLDDTPEHKEHIEHKEHTEHKERPEYSLFYREAHEALKASPEALEYLHKRGISDESIERFNLGYCAAWKHSKAPEKAPGTKRIIIPRTKETYTARRIDPPKDDYEANYTKQVEGRQKDLFNLEALDGAGVVWICEGELDAISLYQAGACAVVGIGTVTNAGRMVEEAKKHPETVFILALDNDPAKEDGSRPGLEAQRKLAQELQTAGLFGLTIDPAGIYGEAKDANEAFVKDRERLGRLVLTIEGKAQEEKQARDERREAELKKRTGAGMLDSFFQVVQTREFEPIPTGITDIDRATEGGFTSKTLVLLSGAPGVGKTALAQLITENIAKTGRDILFINLEMDRNQLLARSLARIAWTEEKGDISPLQALRGYSWTEAQADLMRRARNVYERDIAPRFIYNPDGVTNALDSIFQAMEAEIMRVKAQGRPAPIICIDYLQLIDSGERDAIEGLKRTIYQLKAFAKANNTVILAISATNRASNRTGTVDLESGRDTSATEYSGDMMLGLSFTALEDRLEYETGDYDKKGEPIKAEYTLDDLRRLRREAYDRDEAPPQVCNEISLKVLKNRFGEPERRTKLIFDGRHNLYTMAAKPYQEAQEYAGKSWDDMTK